MKWSEQVWQQALPVYERIITMPFIKELESGTLDPERFKHYISQDAYYLEYFGRALAIIAAKAPDADTMLDYIRFAEGAVVVERSLHLMYFQEYQIIGQREPSPTCHHYIHYLQSEAYSRDFCIGMAAVLPCFWIYKKAGDSIIQHCGTSNRYQSWISTYAGEEFGALVEKAIALCDREAERASPHQQQAMSEAFMYASRLEYAFWDSAYRLEKW